MCVALLKLDIDLPTNCYSCPFKTIINEDKVILWCNLRHAAFKGEQFYRRKHSDCPIKEIPKVPGRLLILSENIIEANKAVMSFSTQRWISEVSLSHATVGIIDMEADNFDNAIAKATPFEEELEDIKTEVNTRKKYIDGDLLFSKIAGHSNYHGDSILSAISCLQEGKEISTIPAIGDNEMRTIDADILEKEIYKLKDKTNDNIERNRAIDDVFTVIAFLLGEIPCSNCANRDKTKIIQNCDEIYKCEEYSHFKAERREQ